MSSKNIISLILFITSIGNVALANIECPNEYINTVNQRAHDGLAKYQYKMGIVYTRGYCVAKDESKAVYWYKKAAHQGNTDAQYALYFDYGTGMGVSKNAHSAKNWLLEAANGNNKKAQYDLGNCYQQGNCPLISKNYSKAIYWYKRSAMQKDLQSILTLGVSYMNGMLGVHNNVEAYKWLNVLYQLDPSSYNPIGDLKSKMTEKDIMVAKSEASQLMHKLKSN